ncbi:MAG: flagellar motor protein MotB, partial [Rhodothermales bacterium]
MGKADNIEPEELEGPSAPFWMVTFSDMVTLLLTFFVMIVAMSEVEVK